MAAAARAGRLIWLQGLACGALVTFASPLAILAGGLMAPAILAAVLEARPGRPVTRVVGLACAAVAASPVWHLWLAGTGTEGALALLADPATLGGAWGAGALGWALTELIPLVLRLSMEAADRARKAAMENERTALLEEWELGAERGEEAPAE
jgi:hypothetical protein